MTKDRPEPAPDPENRDAATGDEKVTPSEVTQECRQRFCDLLQLLAKLGSLEKASGAPRIADVVEHALNILYAEYPLTALDHLIENRKWQHPAEVLGRPRPTSRELLDAYLERTKGQKITPRSRLGQVGKRLRRAAEIAEAARKRRERNRELEWIFGPEKEES